MLTVASQARIYLAAGPTDLRKSFDTLAGQVRNRLKEDPLSGRWFVFCNARRNRIKILFWEPSGYWVCAKRLEKGTFEWPSAEQSTAVHLSPEQLAVLLGGLEWRGMKRRAWYGGREEEKVHN